MDILSFVTGVVERRYLIDNNTEKIYLGKLDQISELKYGDFVVKIPSGTRPGTTLQATSPDGKCFAFKVSIYLPNCLVWS